MAERLLIVGCGSIGERHLRAFREATDWEIALCDPRAEALERVRSAHAVTETYADLGEADLASFHAVAVCTPTDTHVPMARAAVGAGAHVLVEKPLSTTMEGVDALLALAHERHRVLQVGYVLRGHPCLGLIRGWLREGAIGDVLTARVIIGYHVPTYRPDYRDTYWSRTETGGGVLLDASHQLDYLLWLLGPAREVSALTARLGDWDVAADVEDAAVLLVRFASGAIADLQMNHVQRNYTHELVLAGRTGTIAWSYTEGEAALFRAGDGVWERRRFPLERDDLFRAQAAGFAAAVRGQEAPRVTGEDGARALALALAARESARTGRVIQLEVGW